MNIIYIDIDCNETENICKLTSHCDYHCECEHN